MSSKTIKAALKETRELIKSKEFNKARLKCEEILEEDPKNYMGLILMGAAFQETDKNEAAKYLRRAVKCSSDPTVALQGLANCVEADELPEIFEKLLKLVPDKAIEYHSKLVGVGSNSKLLEECVKIFEIEVNSEGAQYPTDRIESSWQSLAKLFLKQNDVPDKWTDLFRKSLEAIISKKDYDNHLDAYKRYLKLLYKLGDIHTLSKEACVMHELYPSEVYPLEWICKLYSENESTTDLILKNPIDYYIEQILKLNNSSSLGILAKAIRLFLVEQFAQARDLLIQAKSLQPSSRTILKFLALSHMKLAAFGLAEHLFKQLEMKNWEYVYCLSHDTELSSWDQAIVVCTELLKEELENDKKQEILKCLARAQFKLEKYEEAKSIMNEIGSSIFEAELTKSPTDSLEILETITDDSFEVNFLKGKMYLDTNQYEKALTSLLIATKQKPYYSECFLYLGLIYSAINDWTRSRKCFEKCILLNPQCQTAIIHLSAIYRRNEEWDFNHALLQSSVKYFQGTKSKWPLMQIGLHNLCQKKYDDAINSFRSALRYDLNDILCWEGLADSYQQRGSFNSALKVYQKILELDPDNPYPKLQVAVIKTTLHMYQESITCFDELLENHPDYLPALKGAAEVHFNYANHLLTLRLVGRCKAHLQKATNYLQKVFVIGKRDMIWLWRLLANVFMTTACMSTSKAFLEVSGKLAGQEEDIVLLEREELCEFAGRFYTCAIILNQEDSLLWHELSLCYYFFALKYGSEGTRSKYLKLALDASKQSIKLQSNRWQNWNLLGVICTTKEINNLPLAQHCFISALQMEKKSATAWTNLGVLYLKQNQTKLANKAFGRAQQSDTGFLNAWIGQAIVAEQIGMSDEAMDLFRHCTQLAFNVESAIGYAYWVCNILTDPNNLKDPRYKYAIENMYAVPFALDSMNWYYGAEDINSSLEGLSYLGYLNSRQSLTQGAIKAYRLAVKKSDKTNKDKMLCNIGYSYLKNNQPIDAIESFNSVAEASLKSSVGLALAHFRASQFEESYKVYNLALEWLANSDADKSLILLAMSAMVYAAQGEGDTKKILLQCIALENPPIQALFSACALGVIHKDFQLADAILEALKPYENDEENCHHIAFLTAQIHAANNQSKKGLMYLISRVHAFPGRPLLRRVLADYLLHIYRRSKSHMGPASKIAESTVVLELRNPRRTKEMSLNASKYLTVASEAMKRVDRARSAKLAQRAIHLNPTCKEAWDVLSSLQIIS